MNDKFNLVSILSVSLFACSNISSIAGEVVTNPVVGSIVSIYTNGYGSVIIQTNIVRKDEALQEVGTNFARGWTNLLSPVEKGPTSSDKALAESFSTNSTFSSFTNAAFMAELFGKVDSATEFFDALKKQGRLPGMASDSHGKANSSDLFQSDSWMSQKIKYPFLLTLDIVLSGDTLTNHYAIMQSSNGAPWKLKRAWRTDSSGAVLKEWPVDNTEPAQHAN